ncbi:protein O-mannosyltransferase 1 [Thrips palmi]|uniref:Protein O-mannosyltransferase 1 n=1 Tax=Thrips palmi TaxID=161013 RepID=A0A6P8ZPG3_THRPL|nr:protein O-mannosyltransferase 1 [Thrips palmi]
MELVNSKEKEKLVKNGLHNDEKEIEEQKQCHKSLKVHIELDCIAVTLFLVGLCMRLYHLEEPKSIVFDELHYGKFVGMYMKRIFFFDQHPPFGKQLVAAVAYLAGFDGEFKFDSIGSPYPASVPIFALRLVPAISGALLLPVAYHVVLELGFSQWTGALAGFFLLCDNALLTQSRFILMEPMLLLLSLLGLLCVLKFRKLREQPYSVKWWLWLSLAATFLTLAVCVKYIGGLTYSLCMAILLRDYWHLLGNRSLPSGALLRQFAGRLCVLIAIPSAVYLAVFYVHLSVLNHAGPHDTIMTSAFQASLEGGLASITHGQPLQVAHGSQITLRHTHGRPCWLHSHDAVYPIRYSDARGSSHQQQVTCYTFKDVNNWWIVKRPDRNDMVVSEPVDAIQHGDVIQLVHGITSRALNSHDVAAAMSPHNQEVSCYIDYNVSMSAQNLWRVEIINEDQTGKVWHAIRSMVRLVHVNTSQALKFSGRQLPDWGFHQHEVVTDKHLVQDDTVWNVEEHRYTKAEDQKERERELVNAEMIPMSATKLTFWDKFLELQYKMLFSNTESVQNHMYSSDPLEWPLLTRGVAYWVSRDSNAQVHLLGNIIVWWSASMGVVVYSMLLVWYTLRRRRACYDLPDYLWTQFVSIGEVLLPGYLIHYLPFFLMDRTLFLHHYLPACVFKVLLLAATVEHIYLLLRNHIKFKMVSVVFQMVIFVWLLIILWVFRKFCVLSYGTTALSVNDVLSLRWRWSWHLILHRNVHL